MLLEQAEEDVGLFLLNNPTPLMIDEIQKCPSIFNRLKFVLDNTDNLMETGQIQNNLFYVSALITTIIALNTN